MTVWLHEKHPIMPFACEVRNVCLQLKHILPNVGSIFRLKWPMAGYGIYMCISILSSFLLSDIRSERVKRRDPVYAMEQIR
jgi:hypothetical protein